MSNYPNPPINKSPQGVESHEGQLISDQYFGHLHTANQPITGTEFPVVYDSYGDASSLHVGTESIKINEHELTLRKMIDMFYPVGSIIMLVTSSEPEIPYTSWTKVSKARFIAGVGTGTDKNGNKKTIVSGGNSGEYNNALSMDEMAEHNHDYDLSDPKFKYFTMWIDKGRIHRGENSVHNNSSFGFTDPFYTGEMKYVGGDKAHENSPPIYGAYVWQRTS